MGEDDPSENHREKDDEENPLWNSGDEMTKKKGSDGKWGVIIRPCNFR